ERRRDGGLPRVLRGARGGASPVLPGLGPLLRRHPGAHVMGGDMRTVARVTLVTGLAAMLTQACAGGAVQGSAGGTLQTTPPPAASTPSFGIAGADSSFTAEWQPDERRGRPIISGYVTNRLGLPTRNVRVWVESLDAGGRVTGTQV